MTKQAILVTGAPRSGTTPVGQILSQLPKTRQLYEPMGPTGDRRFSTRLPMPGEPGCSATEMAQFIQDMHSLNLQFHPQTRPGHSAVRSAATRVLGTRSLASFRLARFQRSALRLIWKDPHAIFCLKPAVEQGSRAVVTMRPPLAHAASYKRLNWVSDIEGIYARYASAFGPVKAVEERMDQIVGQPFASASALWHLAYTQVAKVKALHRSEVYLFDLTKTAEDEMASYEALFSWVGAPMPLKARDTIATRVANAKTAAPPKSGQVHNWNRTAGQANSYWQEVLTDAEAQFVSDLNEPLFAALSGV